MTFRKPSHEEEEYIARQEAETKHRRAQELAKAMQSEEQARLKALHYMHCPKCGMKLEEMTLRGVRIEKCFHCQGIWFDAGEFEQAAGKEHDFVQSILNVFR